MQPLPESPADANARPTGLTVLAVIQFFFAALIFFSLLRLISPKTPDGVAPQSGSIPLYYILSPLLTLTVLVLSAAGYLWQNRRLGYWGGNVLALGSMINIVAYNAAENFVRFPLHLPSLIYPTVLLCLLNLRYRSAFRN